MCWIGKFAVFLTFAVVEFLAYNRCFAQRSGSESKLLVILCDGFRWDYTSKYQLPNFARMASKGAKAEYSMSDYPTLSYPNYYTIMTGLHTESHGISANYMYDMKRDELFYEGYTEESFNPVWWDGGEPLWVTAGKQNSPSYLWYWPGCNTEIRGIRPTFCEPYLGYMTPEMFQSGLASAVEALLNGTTNMAGVFYDQPDDVGHKYGPDSPQVGQSVRDIDAEIGKILNRIEPLQDEKFHLMVVSDHGMSQISESQVINISQTLSQDDYVAITENVANAVIYVKHPEKIEQVCESLKNFHPKMTCYKKEDFPERFHFKDGRYVAHIICMAELGWTIVQPFDKFSNYPQKATGQKLIGHHGYDNLEKDMGGIFYAFGPYFQPGARVEYVHAVDPYNLMCHILGLKPAPNNGSVARLEPLLATPMSTTQSVVLPNQLWTFVLAVAVLSLVCGFLLSRYKGNALRTAKEFERKTT